MKLFLILVGVGIVLMVARRFLVSPKPAHPPLAIGDDDPDMKQAMTKARETVSEFRQLYAQHPDGALVKVTLLTSEPG